MMTLFGIVGLILISVGIWFKRRVQDILFIAGGLALLIYSAGIHNLIFIILQLVFILSAGINLLKSQK